MLVKLSVNFRLMEKIKIALQEEHRQYYAHNTTAISEEYIEIGINLLPTSNHYYAGYFREGSIFGWLRSSGSFLLCNEEEKKLIFAGRRHAIHALLSYILPDLAEEIKSLTVLECFSKSWSPWYECWVPTNKITMKKYEGCHNNDSLAEQGIHEYSSFPCPHCGEEICFSCGVHCTNDSTGEGYISCPKCGQEGGDYK